MKTILITGMLLFTALLQAQKINLTVEMSGFKSDDGRVKVGLYNSDGTFLKTTFKSLSSDIHDHTATVTFEGLEKGEYAVSVYHDENNNGKLDTGFMGIPSEGYASSNNAKGFMGPPKYEDAKFQLKANSKIKITINN
jgi:uncharacterized protein (DUF2141 family)